MSRSTEIGRMLDEIAFEARYTAERTGARDIAPEVINALAEVPRHRFVPESLQEQAYYNGPLPIGHGQTISQPYIVALMTHLLRVGSDSVVLEVGTGSGYQAAVLSRLVSRVYSIEIIPALYEVATRRLAELGYDNVETRLGDGYGGWPEHAPYDGIVVTAATPHIPPALVEQLKPGGRLVVPVGSTWGAQTLTAVECDGSGATREQPVLPVAFVPLTRGEGAG